MFYERNLLLVSFDKLKYNFLLGNKLNKYNIRTLNNEKIKYEEINIIGIDDRQTNDSKINFVKKLFESYKYNLILVHKPTFWNSITKFNDLMLSGHTHNGQIFPFNLFSLLINSLVCY